MEICQFIFTIYRSKYYIYCNFCLLEVVISLFSAPYGTLELIFKPEVMSKLYYPCKYVIRNVKLAQVK